MTQHVDQIHPRILIVNPDGTPTRFFFEWCRCMYERVGGPTDMVADLGTSITPYTYIDANLIESNKTVDTNNLQNLMSPSWDTKPDYSDEIFRQLILSPAWDTKINDELQVITTAVNYTTTSNQLIIATSNITITLNANPKDKEVAIIKRDTTAGTVTISGTIDGSTSYNLITNYEAAHCIYSYDNSTWYII